MQYCFARVQLLKVLIFRLDATAELEDDQEHDLSTHNSIGECGSKVAQDRILG